MKRLSSIVLMFILMFGLLVIPSGKVVENARATPSASRTVLAECFTGTWCTYCQGAEGALDRLADEYSRDELTIIEWHNGDEYVTVDGSGEEREDFYAVSSFPTTYFDGVERYEGGSSDPDDEDLYQEYKAKIELRLGVPAELMIETTGYIEGGRAVIDAIVEAVDSVSYSDLYTHFVLYNDEDETVYVEGREYRLRYTALRSEIQELSIEKGDQINLHQEFSLRADWDLNKLGVVTFVQTHDKERYPSYGPYVDYYTAEVLQSSDFRYSAGVSVSPNSTSARIGMKGKAEFEATVKNTGNGLETFDLVLSKDDLPNGWTANFRVGDVPYSNFGTLTLDAEEADTVTVAISPSHTAKSGESGSVTLVITSGSDPLGQNSIRFKASIGPVPSKPTLSAMATSQTTATLEWSMCSDANFIRYELHRSLTSGFEPGSETLVATVDDSASVSYEITGLTENTAYYFKLRTLNGYGHTDSDELVVNTPAKGSEAEGGVFIPGFECATLMLAALIAMLIFHRWRHEGFGGRCR